MPRRAARRAAPWSAFTRTASSAKPPAARCADRRTDRQTARGRRFLPRSSARRCCCRIRPAPRLRACCWSGLGPRAGFGRKQYRKALQSSAQALAKTGATRCGRVPRARGRAGGLDVQYRARSVAEVFCAQNVQDSRPEDRRRSPSRPSLSSVGVAVGQTRAPAKPWRPGLQHRRSDRRRPRAVARSGESAAQRLYADLPRNARAQGLAKEWPRIKTKVLDEAAIKALKMGAFLAVTQGSHAAAPADRLRISRRARRAARRSA